MFNLNGVHAPVEEGLKVLRQIAPQSRVTASGQPLAFPMHLPDTPLREFLGDYGTATLAEGIRDTYDAFRALTSRGLLAAPDSV